jgi:hypothetical protein
MIKIITFDDLKILMNLQPQFQLNCVTRHCDRVHISPLDPLTNSTLAQPLNLSDNFTPFLRLKLDNTLTKNTKSRSSVDSSVFKNETGEFW